MRADRRVDPAAEPPFDADATFAALAHPVRRATLDALGREPAAVSTLAAGHDMTLPAFLKHLRALEAAGLIRTAKSGRTVTCTLRDAPLRGASAWIAARERLWNDRFDALARHLYHQDELATPKAPAQKEKR